MAGSAAFDIIAIMNGIPALAWSALPDGSLDFVNQPFCDFTGFPSDELNGSKWKSAVHPEDADGFESWWRRREETGEACVTELRLRRFDGEYRWFQVAVAPLHDGQGSL